MIGKTSLVVVALLGAVTSVKIAYRPPEGSVPWHQPASRPTWDTPDYPINYYVPNFGVDHNILTTMNSLKIAERGAKKSLRANFAQSDNPKDLRLPDFGKDEEIKNSLAAIPESEKENKHKLSLDHA